MTSNTLGFRRPFFPSPGGAWFAVNSVPPAEALFLTGFGTLLRRKFLPAFLILDKNLDEQPEPSRRRDEKAEHGQTRTS
jgi:hypothetical protein